MRSSGSHKRGTTHQAASNGCCASRSVHQGIRSLQRVDFSAQRRLMEDHSGGIRSCSNLMSAMPVARGSHQVRKSLEPPAALAPLLKIIAAGTVNEKDVGLRSLRRVVEHAAVRGDAEFKERFVQPDLILQGNKTAALIGGDRGGLRVECVQAKVTVGCAIVKHARMQDVLWREIVLQAEKVVSSPFLESVGAGPQLFDDTKSMLDAYGIGKPKASSFEGPGKSKSRIPVSEVRAFLNIDAGERIGGAEAPSVVTIGSFEAKDAGS